jgi:Bacterial type II and III secretion system protein
MRLPTLILTLLCCSLCGASPIEIEEMAPWFLLPGQTRTLTVPSLQRFTESGGAIRVAPLPGGNDQLLLKAVSPGSSELWLWKPDRVLHLSVQVGRSGQSGPGPQPGPVLMAAQSLREARVQVAGQRILLAGPIQSEAELLRVRQLAESFPNEVSDETSLSPALLAAGRERIRNWLNDEPMAGQLELQELGGQLRVRGTAPDPGTERIWAQKLRSLFAGVRLELKALSPESRTLFFRVTLLEIKRSAFRSLGVSWPTELQARAPIQEIGSLPGFDLTLQALEQDGTARLLSQPELVVRVPGEAQLFSGGEIPIELRTQRGPHVEWKPYGLNLQLKTTELVGDRVRLELSSEISDLDRSNGSQNLPALHANRIRTQVDARIGKGLFISGLFQDRSSRQDRGVPLLARIPLLGALFGTGSRAREESEIVAVLLPLLEPPAPPEGRAREGRVSEGLPEERGPGRSPGIHRHEAFPPRLERRNG